MNAMLKGTKAVIFGDGMQTRDFTFVENAVQANIKAFFSSDERAFGKIFNVAVGETTSVNDLFLLLNKISGKNVKPEYLPERKGDIKNSLADISLAKNLLGYQPEVKTEEGLRVTFEWFRKTFA
jgi:UDP-N-acetylglucosamine 4-epimerase